MMQPHVYYNEYDPFVAQWLGRLIARGVLPAGDIDTRNIWDVAPRDLEGYTQCHFFAGDRWMGARRASRTVAR